MSVAACYSGETFGGMLIDVLRRHTGNVAFVHRGRTFTYRQTADAISRTVQFLDALDLKPGDVIAQLSENCPEVFFLMSAAYIRGFRSVALRTTAASADQAYILDHSDAKVLVVDQKHCEQAAHLQRVAKRKVLTFAHCPNSMGLTDLWAEANSFDTGPLEDRTSPEDIIRIAYTSGTTGRSKGVTFTSRALTSNATLFLAGLRWPEHVRYLCAVPMSHAAGALIMPTLWQGGTCYLQDSFDVDSFLDVIEAHAITVAFTVPTMIYRLLDHARTRYAKIRSLKMLLYGAAPVLPSRLQEAIDLFGPIMVQLYGQTEGLSAILTLAANEHTPERLKLTGRPFPGLKVRLLDDHDRVVGINTVGELCVSGPPVMNGYLKDIEQSEEALRGGWLHTGDLGIENDEGYIAIVDRKKDMIITGGFNVYPREIEDVIHRHPGVADAAVIGVPHPVWGEAVKALVVRRPGFSVETDDLLAFIREASGPINTPKIVQFVDQLPMTPLGKHDKKAMRSI